MGSIADSIPPPSSLPKAMPMGAEPGEGTPNEEGEDAAAELSAMEEFEKAEGPEEKLAAFKNLLATCKTY